MAEVTRYWPPEATPPAVYGMMPGVHQGMLEPRSVYRHHRGYRTVVIRYFADRRKYGVRVWPPIDSDPFVLRNFDLEYWTYAEARLAGDRFADPDCDDTCSPWGPDPRLVRTPEPGASPCPACGWPMRLIVIDEPGKSRVPRKGNWYWNCENRDCPSFDREKHPDARST